MARFICQSTPRNGADKQSPFRFGTRRLLGPVPLAAVAAACAAVLLTWYSRRLSSPLQSDRAADFLGISLPEELEGVPDWKAAAYREARQVVLPLVDRFPDEPGTMEVLAWVYAGFGQPDAAAKAWQRAVELDPAFGDAHLWLGTLANDRGNFAQAAEHFRRAYQADATIAGARTRLALALMNAGALAEAQAELEDELRRHPNDAAALVVAGQVYLQTNEAGKARQRFQTALAIEPDLTDACFGMAAACARLGDQQAAAQYAEKARKLKRREEEAHRQSLKPGLEVRDTPQALARVYTAAGKVWYAHCEVQTAEACWRKAAELVPGDPASRLILAWTLDERGRPDDALRTLTELARALPDEAEIQMQTGLLCVRLRKWEEAEQAFRQLIRISPRQAAPYAGLAQVLLQAGIKRDEARALAQKAVTLEPDNPQIRQLSEAIRGGRQLEGPLPAK